MDDWVWLVNLTWFLLGAGFTLTVFNAWLIIDDFKRSKRTGATKEDVRE